MSLERPGILPPIDRKPGTDVSASVLSYVYAFAQDIQAQENELYLLQNPEADWTLVLFAAGSPPTGRKPGTDASTCSGKYIGFRI